MFTTLNYPMTLAVILQVQPQSLLNLLMTCKTFYNNKRLWTDLGTHLHRKHYINCISSEHRQALQHINANLKTITHQINLPPIQPFKLLDLFDIANTSTLNPQHMIRCMMNDLATTAIAINATANAPQIINGFLKHKNSIIIGQFMVSFKAPTPIYIPHGKSIHIKFIARSNDIVITIGKIQYLTSKRTYASQVPEYKLNGLQYLHNFTTNQYRLRLGTIATEMRGQGITITNHYFEQGKYNQFGLEHGIKRNLVTGTCYVGSVVSNEMNGYGKFNWNDNAYFAGSFVSNQVQGNGMLYLHNTKIYGEFFGNTLTPVSVVHFDGIVKESYWQNNLPVCNGIDLVHPKLQQVIQAMQCTNVLIKPEMVRNRYYPQMLYAAKHVSTISTLEQLMGDSSGVYMCLSCYCKYLQQKYDEVRNPRKSCKRRLFADDDVVMTHDTSDDARTRDQVVHPLYPVFTIGSLRCNYLD
ncbi:Hypothetical protein MVR_LOCUS322 [uncultured virus]|nr:Hypothetical protein MVR_LOCUS322 [uncultured virus]